MYTLSIFNRDCCTQCGCALLPGVLVNYIYAFSENQLELSTPACCCDRIAGLFKVFAHLKSPESSVWE